MTKSFKERNPDLDMDEIQNNPNIPDDIKAVLSGAVLDVGDDVADDATGGGGANTIADDDDDDADEDDMNDANVEAMIMEKYDDIFMDESDDDAIQSVKRTKKSNRRKNDDDDWCAVAKRDNKPRKLPGRPRGRPKRKSAEDVTTSAAAAAADTPEKIRRKPGRVPRKRSDETKSCPVTPAKSPTAAAAASSSSSSKKRPPVLPFNLVDFSKKFEGKIPNIKHQLQQQQQQSPDIDSSTTSVTIKTEAPEQSAGGGSQSIASMLSAGPGKHERKQDKTSIWRNASHHNEPPRVPVYTKYAKPAIIYPSSVRVKMEPIDSDGGVNGNILAIQPTNKVESSSSGTTTNSSNYLMMV